MNNKNNLMIYAVVILVCVNILSGYARLFAQPQDNDSARLLVLINDYKAKIKMLVDELASLKEKQAKLSQENKFYQEELSQLKKISQEKQAQVNADVLNQSKEKLFKLEQGHQDLIKEHQQKISSYEEQLWDFKQDQQAKEKELVFLNQLQAQLKEEKSRLEKQNQELNTLFSQSQLEKNSQINQLKEELTQLKQNQQDKQTGLSALEQANDQLIQAKLNLEKQLNQAIPEKDRQITQLQAELASLKQSQQKNKIQSDDFAKQNTWLKEQYIKDRKTISGLSQRQAALQKEKDTLLNSFRQAEKNITDLKNEIKQNQDLNTLLNQTIPEKDRQLKQLHDELASLKQSQQRSKNETQESLKQNALLKNQLEKQAQDLNIILNQAIPEKDRQITQLQAEIASLKQSQQKNKIQSDDFARQNAWLKEQYIKDRKTISGLDQLQKENDTLLNSLRQAEKSIVDLKNEKEVLFKQNQESSQKLKGYTGKINHISQLEKQNQVLSVLLEQTTRQKDSQINQLQDKINQLKIARQTENKPTQLQDANKTLLEKLRLENKNLSRENESLEAKLSKENMSGRFSVLINQNKKLLKETSVLHYNLGVFYTQAQNYNKAVLEFENVLKFNPNDGEAHYNLGVIYGEYMNDGAKAIAHFKKYLSLSPQDADADRARKYIMAHEEMEKK